jgi:uncharacterized damage-inducible protein DinB
MNTLDRLWKYNDWANKLLFEYFARIPDQVPASCMRLLSHIVNVQVRWLSRMTGEQTAQEAWQVQDLEGCISCHEQGSKGLAAILKKGETELLKPVVYRGPDGNAYQNTYSDILLHVLNHGTYHRAQIAQELRRSGLEPVDTDFIIFARKND